MATEEQLKQFAAKLLTCADPVKWGTTREFQELVGLKAPEFDDEVGNMIRNWYNSRRMPVEPTGIILPKLSRPYIINTARFPDPIFPNWSRGRILEGVIIPKTINVDSLMKSVWQHEEKTEEIRPTGHQLLARLVSDYVIGQDSVGKTYQVKPADKINGHHGFKSLSILADKWKKLPKSFRVWADGKLLYGLADAVREDDGYLSVPCLPCDVPTPCVRWHYLDHRWDGNGFALREQVSP